MTDDRSAYLVETDWLIDRLGDPSVRVLDVTGMLTSELKNVARERVYEEGHVPGAVFFDVASAKGGPWGDSKRGAGPCCARAGWQGSC